MDKFVIRGGNPLLGTIKISGAKNSALPCMAAAILTEDEVILENIPQVRDIETERKLLESMGAEVELGYGRAQHRTSIKCAVLSDPVAVLEATEWYALGFEIIDCVFPGWTFQPADFVAARGLHAALIVGEPVYVEPEDIAQLVTDLAEFTVRLLRNNELVEEGAARNALSPALCIGELAGALTRRGGETLRAGDIVSTGTLTTSLPITPGDTWIASLSGIPPSSLTLRIEP